MRRALVALLAVGLLASSGWAQRPPRGGQPPRQAPPADPGMEMMPPDGMEGQPGATQAPAQPRRVLVLPFLNDSGNPQLGFWSIPLMTVFADYEDLPVSIRSAAAAPAVLESFATGRMSPANARDRAAAVAAVGGDTVLVTRYKLADEVWELTGEIYDLRGAAEQRLGDATARGQSPSVAVLSYLAAVLPKVAAVQVTTEGATPPPATGGGDPGMMEPGMEGAPAMAPPMDPGMMDPGMVEPGAGGPGAVPAGQSAVTIKLVDYELEPWARAVAAWPYHSPADAYRGKLEEAVKQFQVQLGIDPRFHLGHHHAALAAVANGDKSWGVALQTTWTDAQRQATKAKPRDFRSLARVLAAAGRPREAVSAYRQAIDAAKPPAYDDYLAAAELLYQIGDNQQVISLARQAVTAHADRPEAHVIIGRCYLNLRDTRQAAAAFQAAIDLDRTFVPAWQGLIQGHLQVGSPQSRIEAFNTARSLSEAAPESGDAWIVVTEALLGARRPEGALQAAEKALRFSNNSAAGYIAMGMSQLAAGQHAAAVTSFRQAGAVDRVSLEPRRLLARALVFTGDLPGATRTIDEALQLAGPQDIGSTARDYARVAFYSGNYVLASEMLRLAHDYEAFHPEGLMLASFVALYQDDEATAWASFVAALERDTHGHAGNEALDVLTGALEPPNKKVLAEALLGALYQFWGDLPKARDHYRHYLADAPTGYLAQHVAEQLRATDR